MKRKSYLSDITDVEWEVLAPIVEENCPYTRGPKVSLEQYREILNAIFYINKAGVQWQYFPHDFPPYKTVNHHYLKFMGIGLFEKINDTSRKLARNKVKKKNPAQV